MRRCYTISYFDDINDYYAGKNGGSYSTGTSNSYSGSITSGGSYSGGLTSDYTDYSGGAISDGFYGGDVIDNSGLGSDVIYVTPVHRQQDFGRRSRYLLW